MFIIISYDIPDDTRRRKVAQMLEGSGTRVQYSVFECILSQRQYTKIQQRLARTIDTNEDSVRLYVLPADAIPTIKILGVGIVTEQPFVYKV